jgi:hypothetical protein
MTDHDLIETLSDHVHQAWMAEKQRQGFADHVFRPLNRNAMLPSWAHINNRDLCAADGDVTAFVRSDGSPGIPFTDGGTLCGIPKEKHHSDMLPYADLPEHVKEYDRATVRAVLAALEAVGKHVS